MPTNTDYAGAQTLMFTGQSAFYLEGEWEITTAQAVAGLEFGMDPDPDPVRQGGRAGRLAHVRAPADGAHARPRPSGAMGFVKSMLDQSLTWAKGGHIPAYLPTSSSSAYTGR